MFLRVYDANGALKNTSANFSDAEIKTKYENNANTNEFDDAEQTKLAGIEAAADITDAANVAAAGAAMSGGAHHDGFSDFVADEHLNWPAAPAGKNVAFASGQGIDYAANGGTVLDQHKRGTFTATLSGAGGGGTPVDATGYYTKTGDVMVVDVTFSNISTENMTGAVQITGFPEAAVRKTYGSFWGWNISTTLSEKLVVFITSTVVGLQIMDDGNDAVISPGATSRYIRLQITYKV